MGRAHLVMFALLSSAALAAAKATPTEASVLARDEVAIEIMKKWKNPEKCSEGTASAAGDQVAIEYKGMLTDGKVFDDSKDRGRPIIFELGAGQVIRGWDVGLMGMCPGEKRRLTVPPDMAYGRKGVPQAGIPGDATLVFEAELTSIKIRRNKKDGPSSQR